MKVTIYENAGQLPLLAEGSFFHSRELMALCEQTPRHKPYMAVVADDDGRPQAHLLAIVRFRKSLFPPILYKHVRIYGDNGSTPELFGLMLNALTRQLGRRTLYLEVSNLSQKMFGYKQLRAAGFFPVRWMNIHNSLHSRTPEERISERQLQRIKHAERRGAVTKLAENDDELKAFFRLLRHHNWLKPKRYIPDELFFRGMMDGGHCQILVTLWNSHVIGGAVCAYSGNDAYLLYTAARRKSFAPLHPHALTVWHTIKHAHALGRQHIRFLDVGLPFRRNPYRDFILSFGGKEVSSYRWFRISIGWVNRLASWLWRE